MILGFFQFVSLRRLKILGPAVSCFLAAYGLSLASSRLGPHLLLGDGVVALLGLSVLPGILRDAPDLVPLLLGRNVLLRRRRQLVLLDDFLRLILHYVQ